MSAVTRAMALQPNGDAAMMAECVALAGELFRAWCRRDDVPDAAEGVIVRMALHLYGKAGAEGLGAQSYSGQSETLLTDWPADLKHAMQRWRKAVLA